MKKTLLKKLSPLLAISICASLALSGCGDASTASQSTSDVVVSTEDNEDTTSYINEESGEEAETSADASAQTDSSSSTEEATESTITATDVSVTTSYNVTATGALGETDFFTNRDLAQTADLSEATYLTVSDGEDIHITEEGVYVISGSASEMTIYVEATDSDKVQLVLNGVTITNKTEPCIYIAEADKVFVTTSADSSLSVTGTFSFADDEKADAVIFSRSDLVLNGTATLTINSSDTGIESKDDLKVTGGTYVITAETKALSANDSIVVADGSFTLNAGTDGLHAENEDDDTLGYIYIAGGTFNITAGDDGIHATSILQIDGGDMTISAAEGLEATYIQINGGTLNITASDDGINAGQKSYSYSILVEITGGDITISMGSGDTDAIDSNGDLTITGGKITITANSAFDYDGTGTYTGGTLIVNGETVTELTQSMMGGGMGGGRSGFGGGMQFGTDNSQGSVPNGQGAEQGSGTMPGAQQGQGSGTMPGGQGGRGGRSQGTWQ